VSVHSKDRFKKAAIQRAVRWAKALTKRPIMVSPVNMYDTAVYYHRCVLAFLQNSNWNQFYIVLIV